MRALEASKVLPLARVIKIRQPQIGGRARLHSQADATNIIATTSYEAVRAGLGCRTPNAVSRNLNLYCMYIVYFGNASAV